MTGRDSSFSSYTALAKSLVADLTGVCLLDRALGPQGQEGDLQCDIVAKWIQALDWLHSQDSKPLSRRVREQWWTAIPLQLSDGSLVGIFCVCQRLATPPAQPLRYAQDMAGCLRPLLDCISRELATKLPVRAKAEVLTARAEELEWLFNVTSNLKGAADQGRVLEHLVAEATSRLGSALGVLHVPDKRLTVKSNQAKEDNADFLQEWKRTSEHLLNWVNRQRRPLVVRGGSPAGGSTNRYKVLCVPVMRDAEHIIGLLVFYNPPDAPDYSGRQLFLAKHLGRQIGTLVDAQFDLMTGLYTRSGLDQMFSSQAEATEVLEGSVIYLDVDHMHMANDLHGFEVGNELIIRVADLLSAPLLPEGALAARISGDRFVVILRAAPTDDAVSIARSLQAAASKILVGPTHEPFDVSISCGVSALIPMPDGLARAIAAAELACKTAKNHGRNRVELYALEDSSMMRRHADTLAIGQLRSALRAGRMLLYAQRITPLQNPSLPGGYELLLRLRDIDGSIISPGTFITAAQRYSLLPTIDRWVIKHALSMLAPYRGMLATRGLSMSINVSGQSIADATFIQQFTQLLKEANLPRECITVELTEQAAVTNLVNAQQMVSRLGALGCRFALDDFGTGANSLTYLKALNVNRVKIDGSFVRDILTDRNSQATVKAIVELTRNLGIETVAEYVESESIAREVRRLKVGYAQGFAYGEPAPLAEVLEELAIDESRRLHQLFLES
jgi:diguanylate cyclase (GGDEF)-like protein